MAPSIRGGDLGITSSCMDAQFKAGRDLLYVFLGRQAVETSGVASIGVIFLCYTLSLMLFGFGYS